MLRLAATHRRCAPGFRSSAPAIGTSRLRKTEMRRTFCYSRRNWQCQSARPHNSHCSCWSRNRTRMTLTGRPILSHKHDHNCHNWLDRCSNRSRVRCIASRRRDMHIAHPHRLDYPRTLFRTHHNYQHRLVDRYNCQSRERSQPSRRKLRDRRIGPRRRHCRTLRSSAGH